MVNKISFTNILPGQIQVIIFDLVVDKTFKLPLMYQHGAAEVLSTNRKEAGFSRFSDRVAVIDIKPTSNRREVNDYKRQRQGVLYASCG